MSNEYKDWLYDKVADVLFDAGVVDRIEEIVPHWKNHSYSVIGYRHNEKVKFEVWFSDWTGEWKFERRELDK